MKKVSYLWLLVLPVVWPFLMGQGCAPTALPDPETPMVRAHRICTQEFYITESDFDNLIAVIRLDLSRGITYQAEIHSALSGCDACGDNWCAGACTSCAQAAVDAVY